MPKTFPPDPETDDVRWTAEEEATLVADWGTTNVIPLQQALAECDLKSIAHHLRTAPTRKLPDAGTARRRAALCHKLP